MEVEELWSRKLYAVHIYSEVDNIGEIAGLLGLRVLYIWNMNFGYSLSLGFERTQSVLIIMSEKSVKSCSNFGESIMFALIKQKIQL